MLVGDLMTRQLVTVRADTPILEARTLMARKRLRAPSGTDGNRLLGIVTDRDIRLSLPSDATSLSVWELNSLARLTVRALPVVAGERLVGIITETDIVRLFARGQAGAGPGAAAAG